MRRSVFLLLAALLLAAVGPAAGHAGGSGGLLGGGTGVLNIQTATSQGCSPDSWTSPDLAARVWSGTNIIHETYKAQDSIRADWFDLWHTDLAAGSTVAIEVREAEPGGFFFAGTSWLPCDIDPGPGAWLNVTLGSQATTFSSTGNGANAASVSGAVGPAPHLDTPTLVLDNATPTTLRFRWSPAADERAPTKQTLLVRGGSSVELGGSSHEATLTGLEENKAYAVRLVREASPWAAGTTWLSATTSNLAPPVPAVSATPVTEGADVSVDASVSDISNVEVHILRTQSEPLSNATWKGNVSGFGGRAHGTARVGSLAAGQTYYIRAVSVDSGGARSNASVAVTVVPLSAPVLLANATPLVTSDPQGLIVSWSGVNVSAFVRIDVLITNATNASRVGAAAQLPASFVHVEGLWPNASYDITMRGVRASGSSELSRTTTATWARNNTPPLLALDVPATVLRGAQVTANVSFFDAEADAIDLTLDWGDGHRTTSVGSSATHAYAAAGNYLVVLEASDPYAGLGKTSRSVRVAANTPPVARLSLSASEIVAGQSLTADLGASTDADGDVLSFEVSWGDGERSMGASPLVHRYEQAGTFHLVALASDGESGSTPIFADIVVKETPRGPPPVYGEAPPLSPPTPPTVGVTPSPSPLPLVPPPEPSPAEAQAPAAKTVPTPSGRVIPGPGALALVGLIGAVALVMRLRRR